MVNRAETAMEKGLYSNDFSRAFSGLLEKGGVTCYQVGQFSGLDQAYLSRLRHGEKGNPSPETLMKIALALVHWSDKVGLHDIECLFNSAGRSLLVRH